ncbi:uncharacterized protein [Centruroides vittatus]|uniref:uncharacterized protein n=1 Tax=Centruroides vittatus TaxID=120091 RepID=UPI00350F7B83
MSYLTGNSFRILQKRLSNSFLAIKEKFKLPEKYKGGRIERWAEFWKVLFQDYKQVADDIVNESRTKPVKTLTIFGGIGLTAYAIKTNPDETDFRNQLLQYTNDIMILNDAIRNPTADNHMKYLNACVNEGTVRRLNLIAFSIIWIGNYHPDCQLYPSQCSYLKPQYLTFYQRIVDFGIFGQWIGMLQKMKDFDINPKEWKNE